jgi:hypothetical protein
LETTLNHNNIVSIEENPYEEINRSYQHMPITKSLERQRDKKHYPHLKSIDHATQLSKLKELINKEIP